MGAPFEEGQEADLHIDRLAYGGDGVAHPDGFAVFVPRTAPGDVVRVRIETVRRRYARAVPLSWTEKSPDRIAPRCIHFSRCGGCHYQHLPPERIAALKTAHVADALERLGPGGTAVEPIVSPSTPWNYRNRVTYHRSPTGAQGYVAWDTRAILDIEECPIASPALNRLWSVLRPLLSPIPGVDLPFAVLRETTTGDQAVISSVTTGRRPAISRNLNDLADGLPKGVSLFVTEVEAGSRTPFGASFECLKGLPNVREKIDGVEYVLRPDFFFQVNPEITGRIVEQAVLWAEPLAGPFLDLFCGAGLFSLALARSGKPVLGVEINHLAVETAKQSAAINGLEATAAFRAGKAETILKKLRRNRERFPAVLVDPPRRGLNPDVLEALPSLGVEELLYVSCSPPTLARDFKVLATLGFRVKWVRPFDMFPQTYHMETLAALTRNPESGPTAF